jgi:hypothetical protein
MPDEESRSFLRARCSWKQCSPSVNGAASDRADPNDPLPNVTTCATVWTISFALESRRMLEFILHAMGKACAFGTSPGLTTIDPKGKQESMT